MAYPLCRCGAYRITRARPHRQQTRTDPASFFDQPFKLARAAPIAFWLFHNTLIMCCHAPTLVKLVSSNFPVGMADMPDTVNLYAAKTHLSELVERAAAG